jgi:type I restriction enzyme S subunit
MEDSELGLIPKGWAPSKLNNFAHVKYGAPFASKLFNTSGVGKPLIRIRDLKNQMIATWTPEDSPKGFLVKAGELLVGMDGEFNPTLWFGEDSLVNQRICLVQNIESLSPLFLYFSLLPIMKRIEHGATGSTVIHIGKGDIDAILIPNPGKRLLEAYSKTANPMLAKIAILNAQSRSLILIRDALLPRLISGELQIPEEMLAS